MSKFLFKVGDLLSDKSQPSVLLFRRVSVKYYGKASHAAAYPWKGVNALDAAVLAYNNISVLRQQLRPEWRFHGEQRTETVMASV